MKRKTILVVDDNTNTRKHNVEMLEQIGGFEIVEADSFHQAMDIIKTQDFEGAVLDINLDEQDPMNRDGFELLRQLRKRAKTSWVLICAGTVPVSRYELDQYQPLRVDYIDKSEMTSSSFRKRVNALQDGEEALDHQWTTYPVPEAPLTKSPEIFRKRLLVIDNKQGWIERISEIAVSLQLESVPARKYEEAVVLLRGERFDGVTVDMNLSKVEWFPTSYEEAHKLLEMANSLKLPIFIVTGYENAVDINIADRIPNVKGIIYKDERFTIRLTQALESHILAKNDPPHLPTDRLRKAILSVLHLRLKNVSDLERADPIKDLAVSLQRSPDSLVSPLRRVTFEIVDKLTKYAEDVEFLTMGPDISSQFQKESRLSLTEYLLTMIDAKCKSEPEIRKWASPYWTSDSLMGQLWPPRAPIFKHWLFINALYSHYERNKMAKALETLFHVTGRPFNDIRDAALNELIDEVNLRRTEWLQ